MAVLVKSFQGSNRNGAGYQESTTYKGIPESQATTVISLPLFKEFANGKGIAAVIQNITDTDATVVFTFKKCLANFRLQPSNDCRENGLYFV